MGNCKRILVVDDEEQVIFVLRSGLKKLSGEYEIVTARSGQEALEKLRASCFDLIITDLKMPGVDGIALTEVAYALMPGARVIWMTAHDQWEADARRLGVYRYLLKPIDLNEIRQAVGEALETAPNGQVKMPDRKHILIVADEPQEALALYGALDHQPGGEYYVKITLVPDEALSSLKSEHFDMLIAALREPGLDSLDLIRQVRRASPKLRAMLIAERSTPELEEQARQLAAACLGGPLDLADFTASVRRALG